MKTSHFFSHAVLTATLIFVAARSSSAIPLHALTVGGGPEPSMNQFAIESNVRYLDRLLKDVPDKTILFADGNRQTPSVAFLQATPELSDEETAFRWIFDESFDEPEITRFRVPQIAQIDGPSKKASVQNALAALSQKRDGQFLLYFTGHGEPNRAARRRGGADAFENNLFDLWRGETLSVKELAASLKALPTDKPVVLVMVQCFSGAFGNLIFQDGDASKPVVDRNFCGFFATVKERPAAGCTPEINEAEYHDFTSYFFAALSGRDRLNRPISGADYNGDGLVGMNEAFAYSLINEPSIDIPVSTSDVYLRRVIDVPIEEVASASYGHLLGTAATWQKAALEGLSRRLKLSGDDRTRKVHQELENRVRGNVARGAMDWPAALLARRSDIRAALQQKFPDLKADPKTPFYAAARRAALRDMKKYSRQTEQLLDSVQNAADGMDNEEKQEAREAMLYRFLRMARTLALEEALRTKGQPAQKAFFARLRSAEARNPLKS